VWGPVSAAARGLWCGALSLRLDGCGVGPCLCGSMAVVWGPVFAAQGLWCGALPVLLAAQGLWCGALSRLMGAGGVGPKGRAAGPCARGPAGGRRRGWAAQAGGVCRTEGAAAGGAARAPARPLQAPCGGAAAAQARRRPARACSCVWGVLLGSSPFRSWCPSAFFLAFLVGVLGGRARSRARSSGVGCLRHGVMRQALGRAPAQGGQASSSAMAPRARTRAGGAMAPAVLGRSTKHPAPGRGGGRGRQL
jgi:hypothetical protein